MRRIAAAFCVLCLFTLAGCQRQPFYGRCTIEKVDGKVVSVKVVLPNKYGSKEAVYDCNSREDLDRLIAGLESIVLDLKTARDQMPVQEPPPQQQK